MPTPTRFVPKVIVKFKDEIRTLPYADGIGTVIDSLGIGEHLTFGSVGANAKELLASLLGD